MKTLIKLSSAFFIAGAVTGCVYVNDTSGAIEDAYEEARLEGGSYKALRVNDPIYEKVVSVATAAAYEASPTRANVQRTDVMQSAEGDYLVNVVMTGGIRKAKYRLVVVALDENRKFVSKGVILH